MKKIAIIGGGIIGLTLANYLDNTQFQVTLFDDEVGQATKASAGIISPWVSKRRNKKWYELAKDGAAFLPKLVSDFQLDTTIYRPSGSLILRKEQELDALYALAETRKSDAPEMGDLTLLTKEETHQALPLLKAVPALRISGGGRLDGQAYLQHLKKRATARGVQTITARASLTKKQNAWQVTTTSQNKHFDQIVITAGPALKPLLEPLDYQVDIRPQKGQLLEFQTDLHASTHWPVAMLDGEADLIPFENGKILIGATHENEGMWDLTPTKAAFEQLWQHSQTFLTNPEQWLQFPYRYRVGTRAYTSDFAPFFGAVPNDPTLLVASGLGSSGLTVGPLIGYLLAQKLNQDLWDVAHYQKPIETYIQPT
ncbi:NAD(P)/FAD-dependent oxidoreductase [Enterococcus sp. LJL98]